MNKFVVLIVRDHPRIATKVVNTSQIREVTFQYVDSLNDHRFTVVVGDGKHGWCEYLLPARIKTDAQAIKYLEGDNGQ